MADWDQEAPNKAFVDAMLKQVLAVQENAQGTTVVLLHDHKLTLAVSEALMDNNFTNRSPVYWHKVNHTVEGPSGQWVSAVETLTVAHYGSRPPQESVHFSPSPLLRHNIVEYPPVQTKRISQGVIVNPTEKPPHLSMDFFSRYCTDGEWVLVLGFGSGSEIIGALEKNLNVVGIESDPGQFRAIDERLIAYIEAKERADPDVRLDSALNETTTWLKKKAERAELVERALEELKKSQAGAAAAEAGAEGEEDQKGGDKASRGKPRASRRVPASQGAPSAPTQPVRPSAPSAPHVDVCAVCSIPLTESESRMACCFEGCKAVLCDKTPEKLCGDFRCWTCSGQFRCCNEKHIPPHECNG